MPSITKEPLVLNFKQDTLTTISRDALRTMSKRLGFNETQTVLFALARLRDEVLTETPADHDIGPLTAKQHAAITKAAPKRRGTVVDSLLG